MNNFVVLTMGWLLASFSAIGGTSDLSVNKMLIGDSSLLIHGELVVVSDSDAVAGMLFNLLDDESSCKDELARLKAKNRNNKFITNENNGFYASMGNRSHENIWLIRHVNVLDRQCGDVGVFSITAEMKESKLPNTGRIHAPYEFDKPDASQSVAIEKPYSIEETATVPVATRTVNQTYKDRSFVSITYFNDGFQSEANPPDVDEVATALCFAKDQDESSVSVKIPVEVGNPIQENFLGHTVFPVVLLYDSLGEMSTNISYCNIHFRAKTGESRQEVHDITTRIEFEAR